MQHDDARAPQELAALPGAHAVAAGFGGRDARFLLQQADHQADGHAVFHGDRAQGVDGIEQAGVLETLPNWSHSFMINGQTYNYTLLGTDPAAGPATT